jgi:hypothetical protein
MRTLDPSKADLFYTPFYALKSPKEFKRRLGNAVIGMTRGNQTSFTEWETITGSSSIWWKRNLGRDHLIVSNIGGWVWGDFNFLRDAKTLHLTLELFPSMQIPSIANRVVIIPYPSENSAFVPFRKIPGTLTITLFSVTKDLLFFAAFDHRRAGRQKLVRGALLELPVTSPPSIISTPPFKTAEWQANIHRATYCPCPIGDTPSTRRLFNAILAGCVPIIISDQLTLPWDSEVTSITPQNGIDYSDFVIRVFNFLLIRLYRSVKQMLSKILPFFSRG